MLRYAQDPCHGETTVALSHRLMTDPSKHEIPEAFRPDVQRAAEILREHGCSEIFLFGSLASGETHKRTDIDLAVRGCPKGEYFRVLGRLLLELENSVDLVLLDRDDPFGRFLQDQGGLVQVA